HGRGDRPTARRTAADRGYCHSVRGSRRFARDSRRRLAGLATAGSAPVADVLRALHRDRLVLPRADEFRPRARADHATAHGAPLRAAPVPHLLDVARARPPAHERPSRSRSPDPLTGSCAASHESREPVTLRRAERPTNKAETNPRKPLPTSSSSSG